MRYRLRRLLLLLTIMPPLLWIAWGRYLAWTAEQERLNALERALLLFGEDGFWLETPITIGNFNLPATAPAKAGD